MSEVTDLVSFERKGVAGLITLNRPKALNALNMEMLQAMRTTAREWHRDPAVRAVVMKGEGRAFCAGGDVKAVVDGRGDTAFMDEIYRVEYEFDNLLHTFGRPVVPMLHGIVMGGGCGISMHDSHPVAAEDLVLGMPETAIGFFPDVAGSYFLARCPDHIGLYMALTGATLSAADALEFGLTKAIVPRERHGALLDRIAGGTSVDEAIAAEKIAPGDQLPRLQHRDEISRFFAANSVREIVHQLEQDSSQWARDTAAELRRRCPFTLELTLMAVRRAPGHTVAEILKSDFRVSQRMMLRNDYFEGVRSRLIDRDNNPKWQPARLEDVDLKEVEACFDPWTGREMWA